MRPVPAPANNGVMRISSVDEYRHALERLNQLRAAGETDGNHGEMAGLQAAVASYEAQLERSDTNKGKPRSDPHSQFDTKPKRKS